MICIMQLSVCSEEINNTYLLSASKTFLMPYLKHVENYIKILSFHFKIINNYYKNFWNLYLHGNIINPHN